MADEVQFDSATNKRKYEDQSAVGGGSRITTGFSSAPPISSTYSAAPPPSYNSVPPHVDPVQAASDLFFAGVNDIRYGGISGPTDLGQKPIMSAVVSVPASHGYPGPSKKIKIPNGRAGVIIVEGVETIKYLQIRSEAKNPNSPTRGVEFMCTPEQIAKAEQLINDVLSEAESRGSGQESRS